MGQQFYTIRRMPAPGSLAEKALEERRMKSGKEHKKFSIPGLSQDTESEDVQDGPIAETKPKSGQRPQPKRKKPGQASGAGGRQARHDTAGRPTTRRQTTRRQTTRQAIRH